MRVAYVEDNVPHELIDVAAMINYNAYSNKELDDKCELLYNVVKDKLARRVTPRKTFNKTAMRQVPAHVPDKLIAVFNKFDFPELNKFERVTYKMALEVWVRANLKIR